MTGVSGGGGGGGGGGVALNDDAKSNATSGTSAGEFNENDLGNIETETKSISSLKSIGSTQDR